MQHPGAWTRPGSRTILVPGGYGFARVRFVRVRPRMWVRSGIQHRTITTLHNTEKYYFHQHRFAQHIITYCFRQHRFTQQNIDSHNVFTGVVLHWNLNLASNIVRTFALAGRGHWKSRPRSAAAAVILLDESSTQCSSARVKSAAPSVA